MIDYHRIDPEHVAIHYRLENWARWVRVSPPMWTATSPMFRQYQSPATVKRERETVVPVDAKQAWMTEKAVSLLPGPQRTAIRWAYVSRKGPHTATKPLRCTKEQLAVYLRQGRAILLNVLTNPEHSTTIAHETREYA